MRTLLLNPPAFGGFDDEADLGFVLPLSVVSYIFAAVLAEVFLKKDVNWLRWAGTVAIIMGITLVSFDGKQRTYRLARQHHGRRVMFFQRVGKDE